VLYPMYGGLTLTPARERTTHSQKLPSASVTADGDEETADDELPVFSTPHLSPSPAVKTKPPQPTSAVSCSTVEPIMYRDVGK
jgi:hypothetical protein